MKTDLHVHTTASDGRLSPGGVVRLALQSGLSVLAITDHDSIDGVPEALDAACGTGLLVLPGVEINTDVPGGEVHILGYCVDYRHNELCSTLGNLRKERVERGEKMVARLTALGLKIDWNRVSELAGGGSVGRPHVAQALLEAGSVSSLGEAFDKYIGRGGPAYVERGKMTPVDAVCLIKRCGGMAVLAHPHGFGPNRMDGLLKQLIPAGLAGIEAYYTGFGSYDVNALVSVARKNNLLVTGGSDYHGIGGETETQLGGVDVPKEHLDRFLSRARERMPPLFISWNLTLSQ